MKKKLTCLVMMLLIMCLSLFTGCSLVELNSEKYYNATIVNIKDENGKVVSTINNRELLNAYQNMGYYYEYSGYTKEEAVDLTIKMLENRKIIILQAEQNGINKNGDGLTDIEKTYLWQQTVDALQSNLNSYLDEESKDETDETENTVVTYEAFNPTAYLELATVENEETGENENYWQIKVVDEAEGVLDGFNPSQDEYKDYNDEEDHALIYENFFENNKTGKKFDAYKKYLNDIKASEKGQGLSTDPVKVFEREIERLYIQSYENYIVTRYTEELLKRQNDVSSINVQDILDLYSRKVRTAYTQYVIEGDATYDDNMKSKAKDVYYNLEGQENTTYFNVLNILFNKNADEAGKYDLVVRSQNDEGNFEEESREVVSRSVLDAFITNNIESVIANAQNSSDSDVLYDAIKDCVFMYNQDPGMQKADAVYTIGVDKEGKAVSSFVESFNEAGLKLYNQNKIGNIEIAESEYGIHVLVYTGVCENLFAGIDEKFTLADEEYQDGKLSPIEILDKTRVSPMLDKSYFDLLYEELYTDVSSEIQEADTDVLRANYTFVYHKGNIPSALKG